MRSCTSSIICIRGDIEIVEMRLRFRLRMFPPQWRPFGIRRWKNNAATTRTPFVSITMETLPALYPISSCSLCFAGLLSPLNPLSSSFSLPLCFLHPPIPFSSPSGNSFACLYVSSRATRYNATPGCIVDQSHQTNQWLQHDMTTAWCTCNRSYFQRFFHLMSWKLHLTVYLNLLHGPSMISRIVLRNNIIIFMIKIRYFYVKMFRCFIKEYITSKLVKLFISQVINQVINYFN